METEKVMLAPTYDRQLDIFDPNKSENQWTIVVVGAGTIGSWVTLGLTKLGLQNVSVVDDDTIEVHNISNQLYGASQRSLFKVTALNYECSHLSHISISVFIGKFPIPGDIFKERPLIIISAVDSMNSRRAMWEWINQQVPQVDYFIDGRMGGQVIKVYSLNPSNIGDSRKYNDTLHSDTSNVQNQEARDAGDVPCTARSIIDVSFIIAGLIVNHTRKAIMHQPMKFEIIADLRNELTL